MHYKKREIKGGISLFKFQLLNLLLFNGCCVISPLCIPHPPVCLPEILTSISMNTPRMLHAMYLGGKKCAELGGGWST